MYQATIYTETSDGKVEKISADFTSSEERNDWLIGRILSDSFSYFILCSVSEVVSSAQQ